MSVNKRLPDSRAPKEFTLLLVDGEETNTEVLFQLASSATAIICTDGAAEVARKHGFKVNVIIGDLDAITADTLAFYKAQGTTILKETEQETDDLEKALRYLVRSGFNGDLHLANLTGGRIDHTLVNLSVLTRYNDLFRSMIAYHENFELSFITSKRPQLKLNVEVGKLVSLIPLPEAVGVTTSGLKYPLTDATLTFGVREGLSNEIIGEGFVSITSGSLLALTEF